jgi:CubicO group peptidase (beta-lactamase class C family)
MPAISLSTLGVLALDASAQTLGRDQRSDIRQVFADLDQPESPGASVAVMRGGEVIYSEGFGSAQLEYGVPVTPQTIFHVASVSKQFTAMAVLLLEADGRLSLDDDVRKHVPDVPDMGAVVTPRHLLQHTSGVRDQWELLVTAGWRFDDVITKEHVRRLLARQRELNFAPGSEYLYSNMGYSLSADLVERVSGMPFSEFAAERIFRPLGMENTHVHDDHQMIVPRRAYSYRATDGGFQNAVLSYANHGATSLFTTAEDLVTWLDNFRTAELGDSTLLDRMTTRGVLTGGDTIGYALGVTVGDYRGSATVGHGGSDAGFRSQVLWFPEHETGIAVLSNLASGNPGGRARRVADVVLGDVLDPVEPEPDGGEAAVSVPLETLRRYVGRYENDEISLALEIRDGRLWATSPMERPLAARSDRTFDVVGVDVSLVFPEGPGLPASVTAELGGAPTTAMRIPEAEEVDVSPYVGTYYSPEVETLWAIRRGDEGLEVYHLKLGTIGLWPGAGRDTFSGDRFFLRRVAFTRDSGGVVDGFRLTGSRVRNHRFVRLTTELPGGG